MERAPRPVPASADDRAARLAALSARRATPPSGRSTRRHAAKKARAAALALSLASTGGLSLAFAAADHAGASPAAEAAPAPSRQGPATLAAAAPTARGPKPTTTSPATTTAPRHTASVTTTRTPATYTGPVETNKWGPVQVRIAVSGNRITDVAALRTPGHARRSVRINQHATPILRREVLAAQSANIDNVSGATYTTDSYAVSLQAAIDEARAAGALVG